MDILAVLREIFCEVLDSEDIDLKKDTLIQDIPDWDSLATVHIIAAVTQRFRIKITPAEMAEVKGVGDIVALIEGRRQ